MSARAKLSKKLVSYRRVPVFTHQRCGTCSMFRRKPPALLPVGQCALVAGEISAGDVCDRWEAKTP